MSSAQQCLLRTDNIKTGLWKLSSRRRANFRISTCFSRFYFSVLLDCVILLVVLVVQEQVRFILNLFLRDRYLHMEIMVKMDFSDFWKCFAEPPYCICSVGDPKLPTRSSGISATSNYNRGAAALTALGLALGAAVVDAANRNNQRSRSRNNNQGSRSRYNNQGYTRTTQGYTRKRGQYCKTRTGWRQCSSRGWLCSSMLASSLKSLP